MRWQLFELLNLSSSSWRAQLNLPLSGINCCQREEGGRQGKQAKIVAEVREGVRRRYEGEVRVEGSGQKE